MVTLIVSTFEPQKPYPIVEHRFNGRTRAEATAYYNSHLRSDSFLRNCTQQGASPSGPCQVTQRWEGEEEASDGSYAPYGMYAQYQPPSSAGYAWPYQYYPYNYGWGGGWPILWNAGGFRFGGGFHGGGMHGGGGHGGGGHGHGGGGH